MVALWDVSTGAFFPGQERQHKPNEDGAQRSCGEDATMSEAAVCVEGLTNMQSYYGAQLAQSPESSVPWGDAFHFLMAVMLEWCKRVVDGRVPHGALLAHARLKGTTMANEHGTVVPTSGYDWQDHGRDGVAAVKSILLNLGFYPKIVMQVASLTPPAAPTQAMRNIAKKEQAFPSVDWARVTLAGALSCGWTMPGCWRSTPGKCSRVAPMCPTCSAQCPVVIFFLVSSTAPATSK